MNCTHVNVSLLNLEVDCGRDRVRGCRLLTPIRMVRTRNCSLKQNSKFFKQDGKLDYSKHFNSLYGIICTSIAPFIFVRNSIA